MQKSFLVLALMLGNFFGLSAYGFSMASTPEEPFQLSMPQSQLDSLAPLAAFSSQDGNKAGQEGVRDEVREITTRMPQCDLEEEDQCQGGPPELESIELQAMTANLPIVVNKQQGQKRVDIRGASI